jgi:hypothetical protein
MRVRFLSHAYEATWRPRAPEPCAIPLRAGVTAHSYRVRVFLSRCKRAEASPTRGAVHTAARRYRATRSRVQACAGVGGRAQQRTDTRQGPMAASPRSHTGRRGRYGPAPLVDRARGLRHVSRREATHLHHAPPVRHEERPRRRIPAIDQAAGPGAHQSRQALRKIQRLILGDRRERIIACLFKRILHKRSPGDPRRTSHAPAFRLLAALWGATRSTVVVYRLCTNGAVTQLTVSKHDDNYATRFVRTGSRTG